MDCGFQESFYEMNYSIYIYWGGGRVQGEEMEKHTHILRIALFVLLFYTQSLLKELFGIQKSTLVTEFTFNHRLLRAGA